MARAKASSIPDFWPLSDVVSISRQFQRSIRVDTDFRDEASLSGYVCQGTARTLLETMARHIAETRHRAFTWTGPYGGGKSSLALMLCSLVGRNKTLRARARAILDLPAESPVHRAFRASGDGWLVVPVVGKRGKASEEIAQRLAEVRPKRGPRRDLLTELVATAEAHAQGVLVVIDELGKFLESAAQAGEDVYFYQQLAEAANRSEGKLIVVGILHQPFEAYATRLGREAREEWAKVQGRFVDIPLVAATDEVIELVSRAIEVQPGVDTSGAVPTAAVVANAMRNRRPGTPASVHEGIARCWPLHPVVAALLGPISRRRFSQNERSTFGFLSSREPLGFTEFLAESPVEWSSMYGPARFWDYLSANLEPAILASPDGHRWAVAAEAVERAEARGATVHAELTKCVALIELFRGGSGLAPELDVLAVCIQGANREKVACALEDLVAWRVLIERKHLNAFGVFAGSDFDIESAIAHARSELSAPDFSRLSALADLQPILAKRLYHETGTMRWFTRQLIDLESAEGLLGSFAPEKGSAGAFLLCLPSLHTGMEGAHKRLQELSARPQASRIVWGTPKNAHRIWELALELSACEIVMRTRSELAGDAVARKELIGRTGTARSSLENELADAFSLSTWYWRGQEQAVDPSRAISPIASRIAGAIYKRTPVIRSELINREEPSANSNRARKDLMYRMASDQEKENLGYDGYPADAGLYYSILKASGVHRETAPGQWSFAEPTEDESGNMLSLWRDSWEVLAAPGRTVTLSDLYATWAAEPYGLRAGVRPILAMAMFLAHRHALALYVDGAFTPELSEALIDEWLSDPGRVAFKYVSASSNQDSYIEAVSKVVPTAKGRQPLEIARSLVGAVVSLPAWTKRTATVSKEAQQIRAMLLRANDPNKVLFADLPTLLGSSSPDEVERQLGAILGELQNAYPKLIHQVQTTLLDALDHRWSQFAKLRERAQVVKGIAGDFRLEAFVSRLETFDGSLAAVEGLISLACSKPPLQWVDRDMDHVILQLTTWAQDFRRAESLASFRGRATTRRAIGLVFGASKGKDASGSVDIDESDQDLVNEIAQELLLNLKQQRHEVALAALAEVGSLLLSGRTEEAAQ